MSRNRVRRSFTVETKARGRQAPATLPVRAPLLEQTSPAFPSIEAAALFGAPATRIEAEPVERAAPRRILPSLIEAPPPEPEAIEISAREPRLPRVRRAKLTRANVPGEAAADEAVRAGTQRPERAGPAAIVLDGAAPVQPTQARLPRASAPASQPADPVRRALRRPEKALPLGERWKRRLPRVCW